MHELSLLRAHAHKLDRNLRHHVLALLRPPASFPCLLHRPALRLRQATTRLPLIVQFAGDGSALDLGAWNRWFRARGGWVRHHLPAVNALAGHLPLGALFPLVEHELVQRVTLDYEVRALLDVASPAVGAGPVWEAGGGGEGVTVAVLDTGIYPHPDLVGARNRIRAFKDLVAGNPCPYDDNGHGTHCAGDVASDGRSSGGRYRAPAYRADLVGVKVLRKDGGGSASTVMAGVQWCLDHKEAHGLRVLSLSLGGPALLSYREDPLCQILARAWEQGLVCCVAAGNAGPDGRTIQSPGIAPEVITVGAMDDRRTPDRRDDRVAAFSSRGPTPDGLTKPDVLAPGVNVISLRAPGSFLDKTSLGARVDSWYLNLSGTSMATPIAAGVAALVLQRNPALTPNQVKAILTGTAEDRGYPPDVQGAGYLDAAAAVSRAASAHDAPAPEGPAAPGSPGEVPA